MSAKLADAKKAILRYVGDHPCCKAIDIRTFLRLRLGISVGTTRTAVDHLVEEGQLHSQKDLSDHRRFCLYPFSFTPTLASATSMDLRRFMEAKKHA